MLSLVLLACAGRVAFVAGAAAAVGSSVIKVPIAVCIRSVQANVYPNVATAARSITARAGWRGLFTGFVPTLLEDAPDMAVKMAVYESLRAVHRSLHNGQSVSKTAAREHAMMRDASPCMYRARCVVHGLRSPITGTREWHGLTQHSQ